MNKNFDELKLTGKLPTPAGVGMQILRLTQTDDFSSDDIARAVATDPALTGRVLKMANSAVSASIKSVVTVQEALVRLGVRVVRNVALSFSLISAHREGACKSFDFSKFWSDALLEGVAASAAARAFRIANPPEAYVVGLLRGVGRLAFACVHPERYALILEKSGRGNENDLAAGETAEFGISHGELAEAMLNDWGMPPTHSAAVAAVLSSDRSTTPRSEATKKLVESLRLAGLIARVVGSAENPNPEDRENLDKALKTLEISQDGIKQLLDDVCAEWKGWSETLGLGARPSTSTAEKPAKSSDTGSIKTAALANAVPVAPAAAPKVAAEPVKAAEAAPRVAKVETALAPASTSRVMDILAVDDDGLSLTVLTRHLESAGHRVWSAKNGKDALAIALEKNPHVIVSDWNMPVVGGLDLCRSLRRYDAGRRIYFVLLTGVGEEDRIVEAFDAGIDDYIPKPFRPRLLLARVRAAQRVVELQEQVDRDRLIMERQVAELAVLNRRFQEMAHTDALTGLANRRYAMERLHDDWANFQRKGIVFSVVMMDIDHFKLVNDQYGHDVGDIVLQSTANLLRKHCREGEMVCRLGGEEFLVLCSGSTADAAMHCAERLRKRCAETIVEFGSFRRAVTISLGVAEAQASMKTLDELLKAADEAVYRAKEGGRNRSEAAQPAIPIG